MKRKEIKEKIKIVLDFHQEMNEKWEILEKVFGVDTSTGLGELYWRIFDKYTDAIQREIGDEHQWLSWWLWDDKQGANKLAVKPGVGMKHVTVDNLDDLVKLIKGK